MDASKEFMKESGITAKISFKESPVHTVILLKDKLEKFTGMKGEEVTGIKYLVRENGEDKTILTTSMSLVQKLSEFDSGDEVKITYKSIKVGGEFKNTYDVELVKKGVVKVTGNTATETNGAGEELSVEIPELTKEEEDLVDEIPF
jgi:hypothetical protein